MPIECRFSSPGVEDKLTLDDNRAPVIFRMAGNDHYTVVVMSWKHGVLEGAPGASRNQLCVDCIQFQKYGALNEIDLDD